MRGSPHAATWVPHGLDLAGAAETVPRWVCYDDDPIASQEAEFLPVIARENRVVSSLVTATRSVAGVGMTLCRMGLFVEASNGDLLLVARTANDPTLWTATQTLYSRPFATAGGFPATWTLRAGERYRIGLLAVGQSVNPRLYGVRALAGPGVLGTQDPPLWRYRTGEADFAASYAAAGLLSSGTSVLWAAVR